MSIKSFKGKVAVITGAGSGIGQALAWELASKGCHLALADVSGKGLRQTRAGVSNQEVEVSLHVVDVSDKEAMAQLPEDVLAVHGKVNMLFNNAGITYSKTFTGHTLEDWERIVGINMWGVIYGCHFFLPHLLEQGGEAHIVNLSSMVAFMAPPMQTSYSCTKSAIKGLSESLWAELHGQGVGVTVVHPGAIRTNIMGEALKSAEDKKGFARTTEMVDKMAMPVHKAASKILRAVKKDKMRVLIGADAIVFDGAKRALPDYANMLFLLKR